MTIFRIEEIIYYGFEKYIFMVCVDFHNPKPYIVRGWR